jgi:hypothetical protein
MSLCLETTSNLDFSLKFMIVGMARFMDISFDFCFYKLGFYYFYYRL